MTVPGLGSALDAWDSGECRIYSKAEKVFIDGALAFDKATNFMPHTDFDIGVKEWEDK